MAVQRVAAVIRHLSQAPRLQHLRFQAVPERRISPADLQLFRRLTSLRTLSISQPFDGLERWWRHERLTRTRDDQQRVFILDAQSNPNEQTEAEMVRRMREWLGTDSERFDSKGNRASYFCFDDDRLRGGRVQERLAFFDAADVINLSG